MAKDQLKIDQKELSTAFKMKINKAYRYELKPNVSQIILLAKHVGAARFTFNSGLAQRIKRL